MALSGRDRSILDWLTLDRLWDVFDKVGRANDPDSGRISHDLAAYGNTRVDWIETPDAHVLKADLPGIKGDGIKVEVEEGRTLVISGERRPTSADANEKWHRAERYQGNFLRRFVLPDDVQTEGIKAKAEDGVLTVTVPKVKTPKPKVRTISVSKL